MRCYPLPVLCLQAADEMQPAASYSSHHALPQQYGPYSFKLKAKTTCHPSLELGTSRDFWLCSRKVTNMVTNHSSLPVYTKHHKKFLQVPLCLLSTHFLFWTSLLPTRFFLDTREHTTHLHTPMSIPVPTLTLIPTPTPPSHTFLHLPLGSLFQSSVAKVSDAP